MGMEGGGFEIISPRSMGWKTLEVAGQGGWGFFQN